LSAAGQTVDRQDEISLFEVAAIVLQRRRGLAWWVIGSAVIAVIPIIAIKPTYTATATFVPQAQNSGSSAPAGLRSLAGQFGFNLGGAASNESPQFYSDLAKSPTILSPIVQDTFVVSEEGNARRAFTDLMELHSSSAQRRIDDGNELLGELVNTRVNRETGVITLTVTTRWPSVSVGIAERLLKGLNDFNLQTRQSQAREERRFTEARLSDAKQALRASEDRLQMFYERNRQWQNSAQLTFEKDRIQRELDLQQQVVTSLAQAYEDSRIREVRATPVLTVLRAPTIPSMANPRGRMKRGVIGLVVGFVLGIIYALGAEAISRRRRVGDEDLAALTAIARETWAGMFSFWRRPSPPRVERR
jgi:tyrosine-protein kinase Etk/Wzc